MTNPTPSPLILLTATVVEMLPLAKQLHLQQQSPLSWQGEVAGMMVIAQVTGMGPARAAQAIGEAAQVAPGCRILFAGFAGALSPTLNIGSVLCPATVLNESGQPVMVDGQMPGSIVSVDRIISTPQLKAQLASSTQALAVDMESHAAAVAAMELGIKLTIIRSISDEAHQSLPTWSAHCIKENGQTSLRGALLVLLTGPWRLSSLLLMNKRAKLASQSLAYFVEGKIGQWAMN
jgi:adenosylhomocysteine nucleosidase